MSKHDLAAGPIYHYQRASIEAHLTVVFAALAVSRLVEARTCWSIRRFVQIACRYRTVQIHAGGRLLTAADPLSDDLRAAITAIGWPGGAHYWAKSGHHPVHRHFDTVTSMPRDAEPGFACGGDMPRAVED